MKDAFAKKFFGAGRDSAGGACVPLPPRFRILGRDARALERSFARLLLRNGSVRCHPARIPRAVTRRSFGLPAQVIWR